MERLKALAFTFACGALMLAGGTLVFAQTPFSATYTKLTWTAPTTRTDGVPFDIVEEGGKYQLTWTRGSQTGVVTLPPETTEYDISQFKANTSFSIVACDDLAVCSAPSMTVVKPGGPPTSPSMVGQ